MFEHIDNLVEEVHSEKPFGQDDQTTDQFVHAEAVSSQKNGDVCGRADAVDDCFVAVDPSEVAVILRALRRLKP